MQYAERYGIIFRSAAVFEGMATEEGDIGGALSIFTVRVGITTVAPRHEVSAS